MRKITFIFVLLITFILMSCSQLAGGASGYYYVQQSSQNDKDDSTTGPTIDWEEEEDSGGETELPPLPPVIEGEDQVISMFSVLQKDGVMHSAAAPLLAGKLGGSDASYTGYTYNTSTYEDWKLVAKFSGANVPEMWYSGDVSWIPSASGWENYAGANSSAGSNSITNMNYMRTDGFNPFYSPTGSYNQSKYYVYNGDTITGETENIMERFHFYRFTGKGGGVAALDNFLVAVDTYTKLVFSFAKPTKWGSLLGNAVPLAWGPVDEVSTGPGGTKYKFYEYDPAGYVTADGKFVMTADYNKNLAAGNYDPVYTGKSPYLGNLIIGADGSVEGGGGEEEGYAVNGSLTVKAKYIKNVSMTDSWGDHGNADGEDKPEFVYSVRSRAYAGFEAGEWDVLSSYAPENTSMMPSAAKTIQVGKSLQLGGVKEYVFEDIKSGLSVELDSKLVEIDITDNDVVSDYETPIIFLSYDRFSQVWYPIADNETYLRAPAQYPEDFKLGQGETKEFIVTLAASHAEEVQICYELTWNSDTETEAGRIFSVSTTNISDEYEMLGDNGLYDIVYVDTTEASANDDKTLQFEISFDNLDPKGSAIRVDYEASESSSGFIKAVRFDDGFSYGAVANSSPTMRFEVDLMSNAANTQRGTVTLAFSDKSANSVYDLGSSPSEIVFNITREDYTVVNAADLKVSNVTLKNLSVMDVGGEGWGGFDQPEFRYDIKTKHNSNAWDNLTVKTNESTLIQTSWSVPLPGENVHTISNPREGEHTFYVSANIYENDSLAGNANDVIMQHDKPLLEFSYSQFSDSWKYSGLSSYFFTDGSNNQWQIKKVEMEELGRDKTVRVTVSVSSYIHDVIWLSGNIAEWLDGPKNAGWGDMELSFDLTWSGE